MLNIPSTIDDPNYRYKMPKIQAKVEGRGNGIKTNIVNMCDVAKALKRPPGYPTKFFGCELGALSSYTDKEERAIVNGAHDGDKLQELLDKFITLYVLCPKCQLPEIDLSIKKNNIVFKCNACGANDYGENTHKLATYILKNPPDGLDSTTGKKSKTTKEERQALKAARQRGEDENGEVEVVEQEGKDKEKKKKKKDKDGTKKEKKEKKKNSDAGCDENGVDGSPDGTGDDGDDEDSDEKSPATDVKPFKKIKKKKAIDDEAVLEVEALDYDSAEVDDVIERMTNFIADKPDLSVKDFYAEVRNYQVAQGFDAKIRLYVVLACLFGFSRNSDANASAAIGLDPVTFKKKINYVQAVLDATIKSDEILQVLELYVGKHCPQILSGTPPCPFSLVLKVLYDEEAVEEGAYLKHYEQDNDDPEFLQCKKAATFFIQWLEDAEEDSDDDDEDDGDED